MRGKPLRRHPNGIGITGYLSFLLICIEACDGPPTESSALRVHTASQQVQVGADQPFYVLPGPAGLS